MAKTYQIGIIGFGGFGKFLHHHWSKLDQVHIAAVADPAAEKLQDLGATKSYTDWRQMLDDQEIDVMAIVTTPDTHHAIATACMEAGKHVLIEKPLDVALADARKIIEVRDRTQTVAGIDFIMRFNPLLQTLHQLMQRGVFGKLRRVDVENYAQDEELPIGHWFWNPAQSGGILIEHAVHFIDLVHFLQPAKVLAVNGLKHNRNANQEDQIMANVLYEGGLMTTHYHSFARPGYFEVTQIKLAYDLADIELSGWIPFRAKVRALVNQKTKQILENSPFFQLSETVSVENTADESRPAGWGDTRGHVSRHTINSGGIAYEVNEMLTGVFDLQQSKQDVYAQCVQASLLDVIKKIENPSHQLAAPLEAGLESLEIAVRATESARSAYADDRMV
ncbi:MAG: Gfo/Idh/MocA family oxidoreductase [Saprospiraceae bacterium]|nr:Gfo/Idh/MocA family oxidoreductase [Saprospiraceae bacterium]